VRTLAISISGLAQIQRKQGLAECVGNYEEGLHLAERIGDFAQAAISAYNLSLAYKDLSSIRNLDQAEHWCQRSMGLHDPQDLLGRGKCVIILGRIAYERFNEARTSKTAVGYINQALSHYNHALDLLPEDAVDDLAVVHNALGAIYGETENIDKSLEHFRKCIQYRESGGNFYGAGISRFNVAQTMLQAGRLADALEYARAALASFRHFGDRAATHVADAQQLIVQIERAMKAG
jgi:tetratricopeptide (TPR) repeat protein